MYDILKGMRIIEGSSYVAGPTCSLYLSQYGAEVIRFDMIGGGPDFHRWPRAPSGASLYWEALNKGKKSIAINLTHPEGRELAQALITAPGPNRGLFVTNYPAAGFLSHETLSTRRPDLITVRVMGQANGGPALDYSINCAIGIPQITGPASLGDEPVNHVLPAWDLLTGAYAAFTLLAAERYRRECGRGQEIRIPLADLAISSIANLGQLAEVMVTGSNRPRYGNDVYRAFGRDYLTADGKRLMILGVTAKQWSALLQALKIGPAVKKIECARGVSFERDEGIRFEHLDVLVPLVAAAVGARQYADLQVEFDRLGVCWGPYQTMREAVDDPVLVQRNPIFSEIENPSGVRYPVPGAAATLPSAERHTPQAAPRLGQHTEEILAELLALSPGEIGRLHDAGLVASASAEEGAFL